MTKKAPTAKQDPHALLRDILFDLRPAESAALTSITALRAADMTETNIVADTLEVACANPLFEVIRKLEKIVAGEQAEAERQAAA